jgi:hypothetical protein
LIAFDGMTYKLKYPTNYKKSESPPPAKEEQRQGYYDHRDANAMLQLVQGMLVLGFVALHERSSHYFLPLIPSQVSRSVARLWSFR